MEASVAYLRDQIQRHPRSLQLGMQVCSTSLRLSKNVVIVVSQYLAHLADCIGSRAVRSNAVRHETCSGTAGPAQVSQVVS